MRILADENFPSDAVEALRVRGHDVLWARVDFAGTPDSEIVDRPRSEGRLLITFDKDFGELGFRRGLSPPAGIVLFRVRMSSPTAVARLAVAALEARTDWSGHFSVVEEWRIRMTPLPARPERNP